jgi:hypothetical protein
MKIIICLTLVLSIFAEPLSFSQLRDLLQSRTELQVQGDAMNVELFLNRKYNRTGSVLQPIIGKTRKQDLINYILISAKNKEILENWDEVSAAKFRKPSNSTFLEVEGSAFNSKLKKLSRDQLEKFAILAQAYERKQTTNTILGGIEDYIDRVSDKFIMKFIIRIRNKFPEFNLGELRRYESLKKSRRR